MEKAISPGEDYIKRLISFLKRDAVLVTASALAAVSSTAYEPRLEYIDFRVLALLFNLMAIVAALKKFKALDWAAIFLIGRCKSSRGVFIALLSITFFSSMLITNDVALITFVPISLIIGKKANINTLSLVIYQTLAANLGSALTPMGNPQNLYMYSFYNVGSAEFFMMTAPIAMLSVAFLAGIVFVKCEKEALRLGISQVDVSDKKPVYWLCAAFAAVILSVFHVIDYRVALIVTLLTILAIDKRLLLQVDYSLLLTFVAFFVFVGNLSSGYAARSFLSESLRGHGRTYFCAILASQLISNVPASILISRFTDNYKELILGVNIGGMGTMIASMASLISYKLYMNENPLENRKYMGMFALYNILGLLLFTPIIYLLMVDK
ncbi:Na+/H+ antiporter NhaD [Peptoclostridium litorale DSM 5388]|uniref:Arsenical pump membrane protein n=1 Tax=Peptoclostridium litorale DSM 5388 TaxID=1121324 RepID=A0A069RHN5_PEPLI|nr:SLC13 family permease [Peptoclostridium litorale]KDR96539.1 arsenical pump membrane protein [Peptoclostridium litorale DSM 5388]SIN69393.1 Na+/H+ antiporter NhaD [Peptoclostridium litorale DSM 5388]